MIEKNSGKIYRVELPADLGFGFVEVYDFTDTNPVDGTLAYAFSKTIVNIAELVSIDDLRSSGIGLGPIRLHKLPNVRGKGAWKFLYQSDAFIISAIPPYKVHQRFTTEMD